MGSNVVGLIEYNQTFVCVCILSLQGGKEFLMRAHFGLPSVENDEAEGKPPITVKFEIPYFTVSGIQVCVCVCSQCVNICSGIELHVDLTSLSGRGIIMACW